MFDDYALVVQLVLLAWVWVGTEFAGCLLLCILAVVYGWVVIKLLFGLVVIP